MSFVHISQCASALRFVFGLSGVLMFLRFRVGLLAFGFWRWASGVVLLPFTVWDLCSTLRFLQVTCGSHDVLGFAQATCGSSKRLPEVSVISGDAWIWR